MGCTAHSPIHHRPLKFAQKCMQCVYLAGMHMYVCVHVCFWMHVHTFVCVCVVVRGGGNAPYANWASPQKYKFLGPVADGFSWWLPNRHYWKLVPFLWHCSKFDRETLSMALTWLAVALCVTSAEVSVEWCNKMMWTSYNCQQHTQNMKVTIHFRIPEWANSDCFSYSLDIFLFCVLPPQGI